jgi:hypothetical protein
VPRTHHGASHRDNGIHIPALIRQIEEARSVLESNDNMAKIVRELLRVIARNRPARAAFLVRSVSAALDLTSGVPPTALANALSSRTSMGALVTALSSPEALFLLKEEHDPFAAAHVRGLAARQRLLESEGGTLSAPQVGHLLGIERQAVDKRRQKNQLVGVSTGGRNYRYPAWQFAENGVLAGLQDVLHELREHDPWTQIGFFLNGSMRLDGETPLAALRRGEVPAVLRAARAVGEQGAA